MTRREFLVVAVRLFAVGLVLITLRGFPSTIFGLGTVEGETTWAVAIVAAYALLLLVAGALWKFPFAVAALLLPQSDDSAVIAWSQQSVIETASIVIGLFYSFYALSDLLYWLMYVVVLGSMEEPQPPLMAHQWANMLTTIVEVVVALVLIFKAAGVARFIHAIRHAGQAS